MSWYVVDAGGLFLEGAGACFQQQAVRRAASGLGIAGRADRPAAAAEMCRLLHWKLAVRPRRRPPSRCATGKSVNKLSTSVLCGYVIAAYFAYCHIFRIFQRSARRIFFPHKLALERDAVVSFKQFCTAFLHISTAYLVFVRFAYFFNIA